MMTLDFPPDHVHVAFTTPGPDSENQDPNPDIDTPSSALLFAVMGENGNSINIFDGSTFNIKHAINSQGHLVRMFEFGNANRDLVVATTDCKIRTYSLVRYQGILMREIGTVHRGSITSMSISNNSGYFLTGGEDHMIKVWDYEANKTLPFYFQSFIGHTYPVNNLMFNPSNNGVVLSTGENDGIYVWGFAGDVHTSYSYQVGEDSPKKPLKQQTALEKMRVERKQMKGSRLMDENAFEVPAFQAVQTSEP